MTEFSSLYLCHQAIIKLSFRLTPYLDLLGIILNKNTYLVGKIEFSKWENCVVIISFLLFSKAFLALKLPASFASYYFKSAKALQIILVPWISMFLYLGNLAGKFKGQAHPCNPFSLRSINLRHELWFQIPLPMVGGCLSLFRLLKPSCIGREDCKHSLQVIWIYFSLPHTQRHSWSKCQQMWRLRI